MALPKRKRGKQIGRTVSVLEDLKHQLNDAIVMYTTEIKDVTSVPAGFVQGLNHVTEILRITDDKAVVLSVLGFLKALTTYMPIINSPEETFFQTCVPKLIIEYSRSGE